jgi:uncharacterized protein YigE (DUF2233 family)
MMIRLWRPVSGAIGSAAFRVALLVAAALPTPALAVCEAVRHAANDFIVCRVDMKRHRIGLYHKGPDGEAFGGLSALDQHLRRNGQRPLFVMNAGMYHADLAPVGLFVENGRERQRISTNDGPGNFHLKPNGVFFVAGGRAGVMETREFLRRRPQVEFATQSGPMLVINGRMHPRFSATSDSRKVRNGVGTTDGETVFFAISEGGVTFSDFAALFRDRLGTRDALFLDGSVSSLLSPAFTRVGLRYLGPLVAAFER